MTSRSEETIDPSVVAACDAYAEAWKANGRGLVHGVHVDTYCPQCSDPLELGQQRQVHPAETVGVLTCARCSVEWMIQVRLAMGPRLPRRRGHSA